MCPQKLRPLGNVEDLVGTYHWVWQSETREELGQVAGLDSSECLKLFKRSKQPPDTLSGSLEYGTLRTPTFLVSRPDPPEPGIVVDYWDVDWCVWKDDDEGNTPSDGHSLNLTKVRDDNKNPFVHFTIDCGYSVGSIPARLFLLGKKDKDGEDGGRLTDAERERLGIELRDARYETSDSEDDSAQETELVKYDSGQVRNAEDASLNLLQQNWPDAATLDQNEHSGPFAEINAVEQAQGSGGATQTSGSNQSKPFDPLSISKRTRSNGALEDVRDGRRKARRLVSAHRTTQSPNLIPEDQSYRSIDQSERSQTVLPS